MAAWPYSTQRWQRLRALQLREEPLCRYCTLMGRDAIPATVVDHIKTVQDAPDMAFSLDNLQSLCATCHNGPKQHFDRTGGVRGASIDGKPLDPCHPWNASG